MLDERIEQLNKLGISCFDLSISKEQHFDSNTAVTVTVLVPFGYKMADIQAAMLQGVVLELTRQTGN